MTRRVQIHYRRIPNRERIFDQRVVHQDDAVIVTLSEPLDLDFPMTHDGSVMLEAGSLALWFTFPGRWHDIGRFHLADGTPTGLYANILTPVQIDGETWHTTDLFLDIWWPAGGVARLLDEEELDEAYGREQINLEIVSKARAEAARLLEAAAQGEWPPPVVEEWPLERALATVAE